MPSVQRHRVILPGAKHSEKLCRKENVEPQLCLLQLFASRYPTEDCRGVAYAAQVSRAAMGIPTLAGGTRRPLKLLGNLFLN
jgi:hypothetical protein